MPFCLLAQYWTCSVQLVFGKGDIITITQQPEGGWWEGTLGDRTAWFPANYVTPLPVGHQHLRSRSPGALRSPAALPPANSNRVVYRDMVLKDLVQAEQLHLNQLRSLLSSLLEPMKTSKLLSGAEYGVVVGNVEAVIAAQAGLSEALARETSRGGMEQRVGGELLARAASLKTLLRAYARNHPAAVQVVLGHEEAIETLLQSRGCSRQELVVGLSLPFRHLAKYPTTLQELERNMEENHPDRGDTQRAVAVYRALQESCEEARKARETELELLSGSLEGWDGGREGLERLGTVVALAPAAHIHDIGDFTALLFSTSALLLLQRAPDFERYIFRELIQLSGWRVLRPSGSQKELRLEGPSRTVSVTLSSIEETNKWIEALGEQDGLTLDESCSTISPSHPSKYATGHTEAPIPVSVVNRAATLPTRAAAGMNASQHSASGQPLNHALEMIDPALFGSSSSAAGTTQKPLPPPRLYSTYALLPHPAPRGHYAADVTAAADVRLRRQAGQAADEEDAAVLGVVEAFCSASHDSAGPQRPDNPHLLVAEDEKIIVEEMVGDEVVMQEKSLVDTVYVLKDQIGTLQSEVKELRRSLAAEAKARRRLEASRTPASASPLPASLASS